MSELKENSIPERPRTYKVFGVMITALHRPIGVIQEIFRVGVTGYGRWDTGTVFLLDGVIEMGIRNQDLFFSELHTMESQMDTGAAKPERITNAVWTGVCLLKGLHLLSHFCLIIFKMSLGMWFNSFRGRFWFKIRKIRSLARSVTPPKIIHGVLGMELEKEKAIYGEG